jgi:hypothetical protein
MNFLAPGDGLPRFVDELLAKPGLKVRGVHERTSDVRPGRSGGGWRGATGTPYSSSVFGIALAAQRIGSPSACRLFHIRAVPKFRRA